jgi:hypothetical protein
MKTAVEWLINELSIEGYFPYGIPPKIKEKAKEMEKEQIKDAYNHGKFNSVTMGTSEQYYNETFKLENYETYSSRIFRTRIKYG